MNNIDNLVSIAIMKTQWEESKNDFIDILKPFVEYVLFSIKDECISIPEIKKDLLSEFGLKIPSNIIEIILKRLTHVKEGYLKFEDSIFKFTSKKLEIREFDELRDSIRFEQSKVVDSFLGFISKELDTNYPREKAEENLVDYLSKYGSAMMIDRRLPYETEESNTSYYEVGKFISYCYEKDKEIFRGIENIVKGFMIANSMYFHDVSKDDINMKFNNTSVYFDTSFLIYSLGYSGEEIKKSCLELLKLLKKMGANLKCFQHNVYEIEEILSAYCTMYQSGSLKRSRGFDHLINMNYSSSDVMLLISNLKININSLNITIEDTPKYDDNIENIGWKEFDEYLSGKIYYKKDDRREHDIESIAAIYRLRNGYKPKRIEECKAIFVTTNLSLVNYTIEYFKNVEVRNEYQSIIDDVSFTSIAWLKSPNEFPNIPRLHIIADALAAQNPNKQFWNIFVEEVEKLEKEKLLTEEEGLELRYEIYSKNNIMSITSGDSDKISHRAISEVLEMNNKKKHEQILAEKEYFERTADDKQKSLNVIKASIKHEARIIAEKKSKIVRKGYYMAGLVITFIIAIYTVYIIRSDIKSIIGSKNSTFIKWIKLIGLSVSSLVSLFQIISGDSRYNHFINKKEEEKLKNEYDKELEKRKEIIQLADN